MSGPAGPLLPVSETEILIVGGPFAGETLLFDPETGGLQHQSYLFQPVEANPATR